MSSSGLVLQTSTELLSEYKQIKCQVHVHGMLKMEDLFALCFCDMRYVFAVRTIQHIAVCSCDWMV